MLAQLPKLKFHPVTPNCWQDFEKLFGPNGAWPAGNHDQETVGIDCRRLWQDIPILFAWRKRGNRVLHDEFLQPALCPAFARQQFSC